MSSDFNRHAILNNDEVLLDHVGEVTKDHLLEILPRLESILEDHKVSKLLKKRVVYLSIESLQNLQLHGYCGKKGEDLHPEFIFSKGAGTFNIIIGNIVEEQEALILEDKLNKINSLDEEELAYLFGVVIKQSVVRMSSKGGAGLGLIDMRKKSTRKLKFMFQNIGEGLRFFSLRISLPEAL